MTKRKLKAPPIVKGKASTNTVQSQGEAYYGFTSVELIPRSYGDDYFTSPDVDVEFSGAICYTYTDNFNCVAEYPFTIPEALRP